MLAMACDSARDSALPGKIGAGILDGVTIREPSHEDTYDREEWPHWRDADHDCQDARDEVLIAESLIPVEFFNERKCDVTRGKWICPYTGREFTGSGDLDIDHLVSLRNAHVSGGWAWSKEQRQAYANDLDHPEHLVAVEASANRSKGDRGPEDWLPAENVCEYAASWIAIKRRWKLSMSTREDAALRRVVASCRRVAENGKLR
jgi:5-methylcytosine-specific restriction endonuclease McrA